MTVSLFSSALLKTGFLNSSLPCLSFLTFLDSSTIYSFLGGASWEYSLLRTLWTFANQNTEEKESVRFKVSSKLKGWCISLLKSVSLFYFFEFEFEDGSQWFLTFPFYSSLIAGSLHKDNTAFLFIITFYWTFSHFLKRHTPFGIILNLFDHCIHTQSLARTSPVYSLKTAMATVQSNLHLLTIWIIESLSIIRAYDHLSTTYGHLSTNLQWPLFVFVPADIISPYINSS